MCSHLKLPYLDRYLPNLVSRVKPPSTGFDISQLERLEPEPAAERGMLVLSGRP